jgi:tetratricopeptide (TPR) repeat protein
MGTKAKPEVLEAFVGRTSEMNEFEEALRRTADGRGTTVLVSGEAGIGKTKLSEEAGRKAQQLGLDVVWGHCSMEEGAPSFWPWIQVARALRLIRGEKELDSYPGASELARIQPDDGELDDVVAMLPSERVRFQLMDRITTFFLAAARRRPLFIVIDDLQWGDAATLDLTRFMADQVRNSPVVLTFTFRVTDMQDGDPLAHLVAGLPSDVRRLKLEGLDEISTSRVVADVTGVTPGQDAATSIHLQTAGNPFFVREVSKLLVSQGRLQDLASGRDLPVPAAVRDVLEKRFARLSQEASEVLGVASVLGTSFDVQLVEAVGGNRAALDAILEEALSARIIVPEQTPGRYRFVHALMKETLYTGLADTAKRVWHLKAAETLEASAAFPAEIVHHLSAAYPDASASKIISFAEQAGNQSLAVFAYHEAANFFRQALALLPVAEVSFQRARLLLLLAEAEARLGERPQAEAHYRAALDLSRVLGETEPMARAALGLAGGSGGFEVQTFDDGVIRVLEDALEALPEKGTSLRAWVAARLSVALTYTDQPERRRTLAQEAVQLATDLDDPAAQAYALSAYCDTIAGPDHVDEREALAEQMIERAGAAGDPELELLGRRFRLVALAELGRFEEFDRELDRFARVSDDLNQPSSAWFVPLWRAMRAHMLGRYEQSEHLLEDAERIGVTQAHSDNALMLVFSLRWPLFYELGRAAEMDAIVLDIAGRYGAVPAVDVMVGLHHLWMGRRAEAEASLLRLAETGISAFPKDAIWLATLALAVLLSKGLDDARLMPELADELTAYAEMHTLDGIAASFFGSVHHWCATAEAMAGRPDRAAAHFEDALKAHARVGAVVWLAHTRKEYAALLTDLPDADAQARGRDLHAKAEEAYRELDLREALISTSDSLASVAGPASVNHLRKKGDFWDVSYGGRVALLKDSKGMHDLAQLLANPGVEFSVVDLLGVAQQTARPDEVLDHRARDELTRRAAQLKDEIEGAIADGDPERAAVFREELEFIAKELSSAYGLGGRRRTVSDPAERARKTVTSRIRDAVVRIDREHPPLGRHLHNALRTGLFCSYEPEGLIKWEVD